MVFGRLAARPLAPTDVTAAGLARAKVLAQPWRGQTLVGPLVRDPLRWYWAFSAQLGELGLNLQA